MSRPEYILYLSGKEFSINSAEKILKRNLEYKKEKNEIEKYGKFIGKARNYSSAICHFDYSEELTIINILENFLIELKKVGLEELTIALLYEYENQCNLVISPDLMKSLSKFNIYLEITCYQK